MFYGLFFQFLKTFTLRGCNFLNSNPFLRIFSASDAPKGEVQILFGHKKQWSPPVEISLPWVLKCSCKCLAPFRQMFHTLRTNVLLSLKPNVMQSQDKSAAHLRQLPTPFKTMTSSQIIIAPSHGTKNFCVFDANTHLK
jgi:hypothetical protein